MSSSDAQPPLSRRQARERERAAAAGSQPATPPPTVAAPAAETPESRRPGSHVAPAPGGPAQSSAPASAQTAPASASSVPASSPAAGVPPFPPASATEIVPGSGGLTRRQIRQLRAAERQAVQPVPLQDPTPQSSDRTVEDVLGSVDTIDPTAGPQSAPDAEATHDEQPAAPTVLDQAAVAQATEADGSPDALEPLDEAAAHAEEPRRHRSTWSPPADVTDSDTPATDVPESDAPVNDAPADETTDVAPADEPSKDAPAPAAGSQPAVTPVPIPTNTAAATPAVFPLSLDAEDDDTNEVPLPEPATEAPKVPAAFQRPTEPKPVTTAFAPPAGHWSQQAHDSNDSEVHDAETGTRRVAVTNTNAIILPNSALADPTGALNATGEVILTGSIDLPASLSSTGSHRPIDGAEVDRLLEQQDEQPDTDASPVRASRAVSSHTSTRQVVLAAAKPKESRTPLILGVTVGAVGLAAAGVIITALLTTHAFGG
ncbi:hypothetical protein [Curtobacterium flaccumfaciens]|uniref:hypothetical protein n=1 Tax=Curtobacterium flaccumfaciens TaxID=2035 RepID=UPI001BDDD73B|nr:hypothetical protein [Curtobacterium flaccumfaciens]MBT1608391.1 hypothetical protein [Curtobacterium flaccumfaciens pv. betae]MBT1658329.1 hypothetical protein [Curtobacterium flaccumfaciens pv. betae]MCS0471085.1 hypothetical protein [Curtobacterium flaccumfaciens pv. betae]MCS0474342.1 hypothetical protein [Curtobacterium flaccumfaciens pv. betae]MCS0477785.1 hypothetical protein [Curtobacterium flaccumfaciens pv. betae]